MAGVTANRSSATLMQEEVVLKRVLIFLSWSLLTVLPVMKQIITLTLVMPRTGAHALA